MSNNKQSVDAYELQKLIEKGKRGELWSVQVLYRTEGESKLHIRRNMTGERTMEFRERMFRFGFELIIQPGHWKIICPMDIESVEMIQQDAYIPGGPAGIPT